MRSFSILAPLVAVLPAIAQAQWIEGWTENPAASGEKCQGAALSPQLSTTGGSSSECTIIAGAKCFVYEAPFGCTLRSARTCEEIDGNALGLKYITELNSENELARFNEQYNHTSFALE